jgi:hypothetical protein
VLALNLQAAIEIRVVALASSTPSAFPGLAATLAGMACVHCSPDNQFQMPPGIGESGEHNRRTRLEKGLLAELVGWLHRTVRVHAHLLSIVRLYGNPSKAGGQSNEGEAYAARAARGDRTMLFDALTVAGDEIDAIREEVHRIMESAPPTKHPPGSPGKVEEMALRMHRGDSLFIAADAKTDLE